MNEQKSLLTYLVEALDRYRAARRRTAQEQAFPKRPGRLRQLLPTPGNVFFTLLMVAGLLWAGSAGALPLRAPAATTSTGTIAYQGRLADADGNPITNTVNMIFRLYDVASGGAPLWEEQWTGSNGVQVNDGLFNVMLGSLTPTPTPTPEPTPTPTPTPACEFPQISINDGTLFTNDPDNNLDTPNYKGRYDLDHDCDIDIVDIMLVVKHWGESCG